MIRRGVAVTMVAALLGAGAVASDAATPKSYKSCRALHKDYPHGVGRAGARDKTSGRRVTTFRVSTRVYRYNDGKAPRHSGEHDLDRDNDGIACEKL
jgi:hypothetical protein